MLFLYGIGAWLVEWLASTITAVCIIRESSGAYFLSHIAQRQKTSSFNIIDADVFEGYLVSSRGREGVEVLRQGLAEIKIKKWSKEKRKPNKNKEQARSALQIILVSSNYKTDDRTQRVNRDSIRLCQ